MNLDYVKRDPVMFKKAMDVRKHVYKVVVKLDVEMNRTDEPLPFEKRNDGKLKKVTKKITAWGKPFSCAWFHLTGTIPAQYLGKKLGIILNNGGEGLLVDKDGNPVASTSGVHDTAFEFCAAERKFYMDLPDSLNPNVDLWVDSGYNAERGFGLFRRADIVFTRENAYKFYYDFLGVTLAYFTFVEAGDEENKKLYKDTLNRALKLVGDYSDEKIEKADAELHKLLDVPSEEDFTLYAMGHSHLDLAWLWPIRETKRKSIRTIVNAINMIDRYPGYVYGLSQFQQLEWLEETSPELYKRFAQKVADGSIELQGGMWVESDTNLISGESLLRQIMFGKRYTKEHFGKEMRMVWEPDVFGYTAALPQIMKKTGIDYFMTQKLSWNEHNKFPYSTFVWEGLDDSTVVVHMPPEDTYNSNANAFSNSHARIKFKEKDRFNKALLLFGQGDGGGGAGEAHLELLKRTENLYKQPKVKNSQAIDFFDDIAPEADKMDRYKGELYLEKHQGTYTSQANNKKFNRKIEYLLRDIEYFGAIASSKGLDYPKVEMDKIWKEVLLYQFHDIIPGSSIHRVYVETTERYLALFEELKAIKNKLLESIYTGKDKSLFNTTEYDREEVVEFDGKACLATAKPFAKADIREITAEDNKELVATKTTLENKYLKATFSKNGNIVSLIDKATGKETASEEGLNNLRVYIDKKLHYNAWDIDINYTNQAEQYFIPKHVEFFVEGGRAVRRTTYKYDLSTIVQDVVLEFNKPYVKFVTKADWHERLKMLRAEFYPKAFAPEVRCDIQFGNIMRTTKTDDKLSWAQFEICAHKYVDVSDKGEGSAVMCESKYGYRVKDGLISLNLLRSPIYPDPKADIGKHEFTYIFMPHQGDCFEADVPKYSYLLNIPMVEIGGEIAGGEMAVDKRNIIIETVKPAENGNGYVVRLYENEGKVAETAFATALEYASVVETDMLENETGAVKIGKLTFKPYEVKTLWFKRK